MIFKIKIKLDHNLLSDFSNFVTNLLFKSNLKYKSIILLNKIYLSILFLSFDNIY